MQVAIIGGGIIGATAAHGLLDAGHAVTIVDPGGFGDGASRGNAGTLHASSGAMGSGNPNAEREAIEALIAMGSM